MSLPSLDHFDYREYNHFYEPAEDTYLLVDALHAEQDFIRRTVDPHICLEIGPGSGVVTAALSAMLRDRDGGGGSRPLFMAAEVNRSAAEACVRTAVANKVEPFEVICCDLALCLSDRLRGEVDILLFNPPYVPTPSQEVGSKDIAAAWAGGVRGREVIDRFLPLVKGLLSPRGCFYMVAVEENDPDEIMGVMRETGLHAEVDVHRASYEMSCTTCTSAQVEGDVCPSGEGMRGRDSPQARRKMADMTLLVTGSHVAGSEVRAASGRAPRLGGEGTNGIDGNFGDG